jgi:hypothetical protein
MQVARRSVIPMVLGVMSIVYGGFGLLGQAIYPLMMAIMPPEMEKMQQEALAQSGYSMAMMYAFIAFYAVTSLILLISAFGLVTYRRWGRIGFHIYAVLAILSALYGAVIAMTQELPPMPPEMAAMAGSIETAQRVMGVIMNLAFLLFPVLGVIFLNRRSAIAALN